MDSLMALLVKEKLALEKLEDSFIGYFAVIGGDDISDEIDREISIEERLLKLSVLLDGAV